MLLRSSKAGLILVITMCLQAQPQDDESFVRFMAWLAQRPPVSRPADLIAPYRQELIKSGLPEKDAERELAKLWRRAYTDPEGSRVLWNKLYSAKDEPIFRMQPSKLLMRAVEGVTPGAALDFGMGQGRNAVFLATQQWSVTGFDPSDEAVRIASENAARQGVMLKAVVARDDQFDLGKDQWDLIVMTFVRTPTKADAARFWQALKPGGLFIYEDGVDDNHGVLDAFERFRIRFFEDVNDKGDWNPQEVNRHQRMVAEKPKVP